MTSEQEQFVAHSYLDRTHCMPQLAHVCFCYKAWTYDAMWLYNNTHCSLPPFLINYTFLMVMGYHGSAGPAGAQGVIAFVFVISTALAASICHCRLWSLKHTNLSSSLFSAIIKRIVLHESLSFQCYHLCRVCTPVNQSIVCWSLFQQALCKNQGNWPDFQIPWATGTRLV